MAPTMTDEGQSCREDRCARCACKRGSAADAGHTAKGDEGIGKERCVFCLSADGAQYVPVHMDDGGSELAYVGALGAHCACASCWAAWEERQLRKPPRLRRPWVARVAQQGHLGLLPCPVCQRRVDVRHGYAAGPLCAPCLDEVVLQTPPGARPKQDEEERCCHCGCPAAAMICLLFTAAGMIPLVARGVLDFALDRSLEVLDGTPGAELERILPPGVMEVMCPMLDKMAVFEPLRGGLLDPVMSMAWAVGQKVCGASSARRTARTRPSRSELRLFVPSTPSLSAEGAGAVAETPSRAEESSAEERQGEQREL